jgi:aminoglycoside phosphotransferase (APT) family kinase protein
MHWALPADGRSGLAGVDLAAIGLPTQAECAERYCRLTGRTETPELSWYIAFHMFRVAVLYESIAARMRAGNAAGANAAALVGSIPAIAAAALALAAPGAETGF